MHSTTYEVGYTASYEIKFYLGNGIILYRSQAWSWVYWYVNTGKPIDSRVLSAAFKEYKRTNNTDLKELLLHAGVLP